MANSKRNRTPAAAGKEIAVLRQEIKSLRERVATAEKRSNAALQALANFSLMEDRHPTHSDPAYQQPKVTKHDVLEKLLAQGLPGLEKAVYMLGTYCFDLSRRFAFVHTGVSKVLPATIRPDARLKRETDDDDKALHRPKGDNWRDRAAIAGRQLKKWHNRAHDQLVARAKSQ